LALLNEPVAKKTKKEIDVFSVQDLPGV